MMKTLKNLVLKDLRLNKKRSIVTILGIVLSTALIFAVAGMFFSLERTMLNRAISDYGNYQATIENIAYDDLKYIENNRQVKDVYLSQYIGYANIENSHNIDKPFLYLMGMSSDMIENSGLKLVDGRFPENDSEIVINERINSDNDLDYKVGDTITLDIGDRLASDNSRLMQMNPYLNTMYDDKELEEPTETETFSKKFTKTYTIVGIIERPNYNIESISAPGYTVITLNTQFTDTITAGIVFKDVRKTYESIADMGLQDKYNVTYNTEYLRWSGVTRDDNTTKMLNGLLAIVIGIIIVASIFVIRNSFAISTTEKMNQYGMLSSIGATKKQIRKMVLFEAFILGTIGVLIGMLCGCLATYILVIFSEVMIGDLMESGVSFAFYIPIAVYLITIIGAFITIYLSAISSAIKASRVSPIEAIRNSSNIKIRSKNVRSNKLIKSIFGIGGDIAYKNLKRSRKKYRTTVISLVVSITIFISLSTFITYAFDLTTVYYGGEHNVEVYDNESDFEALKNNRERILSLNNISKYTYLRSSFVTIDGLVSYMSDEYKDYLTEMMDNYSLDEESLFSEGITLSSIGDKSYISFLNELELSYEECHDNIIYIPTNIEDNNEYFKAYTFKDGDILAMKSEDFDTNLEIIAVTDERPFGLQNYFSDQGIFLVSDEFMDKFSDQYYNWLYIKSDDAKTLTADIEALDINTLSISNIDEIYQENRRVIIWISVFLYGFIIVITLIGVTNIFNTITTNMSLRSKEFAMLKSVGMTSREFNRMIRLESIFYGAKSLFFGIIIGTALSYVIYRIYGQGMYFEFIYPTKAIVISIIFIVLVVGMTMRYSLKRINRQNIIETIRKDNI